MRPPRAAAAKSTLPSPSELQQSDHSDQEEDRVKKVKLFEEEDFSLISDRKLKRRQKRSSSAAFPLLNLPPELILLVLSFLPATEDKYALTRSSSKFLALLPLPSPDRSNVLWSLSPRLLSFQNTYAEYSIAGIRFIRLFYDQYHSISGCERCGRAKVRKICWRYGSRLCTECRNEVDQTIKRKRKAEELALLDLAKKEKAINDQKNREKKADNLIIEAMKFEELDDEHQIADRVERLVKHLSVHNARHRYVPYNLLHIADIEHLDSFESFKLQRSYNIYASSWMKKFRDEILTLRNEAMPEPEKDTDSDPDLED